MKLTTVLLLLSSTGLFGQGPANVSVTPDSGSQSYQRVVPIIAKWSSPRGAGNINVVLFYMGHCYVSYTARTRNIALYDFDNSVWVDATGQVGRGSAITKRCEVGADFAHMDGDNLTVQFLLKFPFTGGGTQPGGIQYPIYLAVMDDQGVVAGFEQRGSFGITIP